jgi:hypothetical protein
LTAVKGDAILHELPLWEADDDDPMRAMIYDRHILFTVTAVTARGGLFVPLVPGGTVTVCALCPSFGGRHRY